MESKIPINKILKHISEPNTKEIYWYILKDVMQRPTSEQKWAEKTDLDLSEEEWTTVYTINNGLTRDTTIIDFQFKITHRTLACGYNLKIWKINDSSECETCKDTDTIEHYLIYCKPVYEFWSFLLNWWSRTIKVIFRVDTYEILFGIPNDEQDTIISQFNYMLLMARFYIYKSKKAGNKLDLYMLLLACKNNLMLEENIMAAKKQSGKFNKQWQELYENL
jgi:predicted Zn-ribbon and HTH transcriptional regulator